MPDYDYHCDYCQKTRTVTKPMKVAHRQERCRSCRAVMQRVFEVPIVNWNHWVPDLRQMDGEKEAIAAGMDE